MREGSVKNVHQTDTVIVDELYANTLGIAHRGEAVEIQDTQATIGWISKEVRTFTASPFVFTSIKSAIKYDKRNRADEITYVLMRCAPGFSQEQVKNAIARAIPDIDVLTTPEFARLTIRYWMLETGVGITVVLTAILGICIGAIITSQTLYAITQDHLRDYTTLLAIGFRPGTLTGLILLQSLLLGICGIVGGSIFFFPAAWFSQTTPIPLETTPFVFGGLLLLSLLICGVASLMSVRSLFRIDPAAVFHAS